MSKNLVLLLGWVRLDDSDQYSRGYTDGFYCAVRQDLEPWEQAHFENIRKARRNGASA